MTSKLSLNDTEMMDPEAIQADGVLTALIEQLKAETRVLEALPAAGFRKRSAETCRRICLSHLVITLSKWLEFYTHFSTVIPSDILPACKNLVKEFESRRIPRFRNRYFGRIWDRRQQRPLDCRQLEAALEAIVGNDVPRFLKWIHDPENGRFPETVVSVLGHTRRRIREKYHLEDLRQIPDDV